MIQELADRLRQLDPDLGAQGFSLTDFAYARGNVLDALVYLSVIWPTFVEVLGMVFREADVENDEDRARVRQALDRYKSRCEVEASFNWVDVGNLFAPRNFVSTEAEDRQLAILLQEAWSAKLRRDFPQRQFAVAVLSPRETGGSYGVRFVEDR